MKTSIVILNWNGKKFLEKFLPSVIEFSGDAEIIVADNDSKDESVEFMKTNYPEIRLIINGENGGYAKGYNDALKHVESEYYVLLNSDIEVTPGWLDPVINLMDSDEKIAACQPKLLAYNQKDEYEYAGASGGFIDKYGYPFCRGRVFGNLEKDLGKYENATEVFWATGASLFVRSRAFWEVGGLDSDFFAHMEEIDLCWRMKNAGYKIMVQPKSVIYHVGGGTLPKNSPFKTYLNFRNNMLLLQKNLPRNRFIFVMIYRLLWDGVAGLKFLLEGHHKDMLAVIKAHFSFYKMSAKNRKKRVKNATFPIPKMYMKNIVVQHYLFKKNRFDQLESGDFWENNL